MRGTAEGIGSNPNLRSYCLFGVSSFAFVVSFEFLRCFGDGTKECEILVKGLLYVPIEVVQKRYFYDVIDA